MPDPKRTTKNLGFITDPLATVLAKFVMKNPAFERFRHCTICITHIYDTSLSISKAGRMRDYDNIELKAIIDVINRYLLTDDSGFYCNTFQSSRESDADMTLIEIMKKDMFHEWLLLPENRV